MMRKNDQDVDAQSQRNWHFEKTVSIGHLLTTLSIAGSILIWAMHMESRITILQAGLTYSKEADVRMEQGMHDKFSELTTTLVRIESKIDGKVDKH